MLTTTGFDEVHYWTATKFPSGMTTSNALLQLESCHLVAWTYYMNQLGSNWYIDGSLSSATQNKQRALRLATKTKL